MRIGLGNFERDKVRILEMKGGAALIKFGRNGTKNLEREKDEFRQGKFEVAGEEVGVMGRKKW